VWNIYAGTVPKATANAPAIPPRATPSIKSKVINGKMTNIKKQHLVPLLQLLLIDLEQISDAHPYIVPKSPTPKMKRGKNTNPMRNMIN
jgi:hypothetical protein